MKNFTFEQRDNGVDLHCDRDGCLGVDTDITGWNLEEVMDLVMAHNSTCHPTLLPRTWDAIKVGEYVPGSGDVVRKTAHPAAKGWHITFKRRVGEPFSFSEQWTTFHLGNDRVPTRLDKKGLHYD